MTISNAAQTDTDKDAISESPLTDEQMKQMRVLPFVGTMRRRLRFTQEEFSNRFAIPLGTLRDWEQGRSEPDATSQAYLKVIAADPERVAEVIAKKVA